MHVHFEWRHVLPPCVLCLQISTLPIAVLINNSPQISGSDLTAYYSLTGCARVMESGMGVPVSCVESGMRPPLKLIVSICLTVVLFSSKLVLYY